MCRLGIHKWGKWERVEVKVRTIYDKEDHVVQKQMRECTDCGLSKVMSLS